MYAHASSLEAAWGCDHWTSYSSPNFAQQLLRDLPLVPEAIASDETDVMNVNAVMVRSFIYGVFLEFYLYLFYTNGTEGRSKGRKPGRAMQRES